MAHDDDSALHCLLQLIVKQNFPLFMEDLSATMSHKVFGRELPLICISKGVLKIVRELPLKKSSVNRTFQMKMTYCFEVRNVLTES
jgi:hypothetical protein